MRSGLLLLLLGLPGAALAAEDRYGPSRGREPVAVPAAAPATPPALAAPQPGDYRGPLLSWSGKPAAAVRPAAAVSAPPTPGVAAPVPPPRLYASRGSEPVRLPTSLYDTPAPVAQPHPAPPPAAVPPAAVAPPAPPVAPAPISQPGVAMPAAARPPVAQPQAVWPQAAAGLPPPPAAAPVGSPSYAYNPPRAYSVVREWGGTPDRIPTPPKAFNGREVALDPLTLGAPQQPDPPPEDEADEEQPLPRKPSKDARK